MRELLQWVAWLTCPGLVVLFGVWAGVEEVRRRVLERRGQDEAVKR